MRRTAADLADEALEHLDVLREHVWLAGAESRTAIDAISLRRSSALDCIGQLPPDVRDAVCDQEWPAVRSTRNRIAHGYSVVDADVIRAAVATRLDALEERLRVVAASGTGSS